MKNKLMRNAVNNSYFLNSKKNEEKRDVRCKLNGTSISKDDIFFSNSIINQIRIWFESENHIMNIHFNLISKTFILI